MSTSSSTFQEESAPLAIALNFYLTDFDSSDANTADLNLTVTLVHAVDAEYEGLSFSAEGTGVIVEEVARTGAPEYRVQYVLRNASSYDEYEQVNYLFIRVVVNVSLLTRKG